MYYVCVFNSEKEREKKYYLFSRTMVLYQKDVNCKMFKYILFTYENVLSAIISIVNHSKYLLSDLRQC